MRRDEGTDGFLRSERLNGAREERGEERTDKLRIDTVGFLC